MKRIILMPLLFLLMQPAISQDHSKELEDVKAACYNYIDAFYKADTSLAYQSVHKNLRKIGAYFMEDAANYSDPLEMPFNDLVNLAKTWNKEGEKADGSSERSVEIFEVSDKTAVAKVNAVWGIDYISLIKDENQWKIINVLWQSPPKFSFREH